MEEYLDIQELGNSDVMKRLTCEYCVCVLCMNVFECLKVVRRAVWREMAATLPSVCPRAAVATKRSLPPQVRMCMNE